MIEHVPAVDHSEVWKPVPSAPGYEASSAGRVRSTKQGGRVIVQKLFPRDGRPVVKVQIDGKQRTRYVHRLVAEAFHGPKPPRLQTRHFDGDRLNNRASSLIYGTASQNMQDRVRHGGDPNARKTHCPRNHPYDERNTLRRRNGHRYCRTCKNQARRVQRPAVAAPEVKAS